MTEILKVDDFDRLIVEGEGLKIVRFCAEWSGPCHIMGPIYDELYKIYSHSVEFFKIDIDRAPELTQQMGVTELPTILFYRNGVSLDYVAGLIPREELIDKLKKAIKEMGADSNSGMIN